MSEASAAAIADDRRRNAAQRNARFADARPVERDDDGDADHRDRLRLAQSQLEEDAAPRRPELAHRDRPHELARLQRRGAETGAELFDRQPAAAAGAREFDLGIERVEGGDRVVGGRGGDEVAGDRAARADLRGADFGARLDQRQRVAAEGRRAEHVVVGGERAEREAVAVVADEAQLGLERGEIDQAFGRLTSAPELDHHVGTPGDQPGTGRGLGEFGERVGQRGGPTIDLDHLHMFGLHGRLSSSSLSHLVVLMPDDWRTASGRPVHKPSPCT